jgi:hypothetical protein
MKIRNGFVSNSSSSSFILALNDYKKDDKIKIVVELDLSKKITHIISNKEELDKYFIDYYYLKNVNIEYIFAENKELKKDYYKLLSFLDQGKTVLVGDVSNEGWDSDLLDNVIMNRGIKDYLVDKNIEVIEDGRY